MYISSKVAAQTATTILSLLVTMIVTHFGLSLNAADSALISSGITVVASAFAGWYVKEADPDELKRSATKAKLVRDFKEKVRTGRPLILDGGIVQEPREDDSIPAKLSHGHYLLFGMPVTEESFEAFKATGAWPQHRIQL